MKSQQPAVIDISSDEKRYTHPAYGVVTVSRPQSTPPAHLFGSEIGHSHYITVRVSKAELIRDLYRDWIHPREVLIEFNLSEAQWAKMVAGAGRSQATPVTLSMTAEGPLEHVPGITPKDESRKEKFDEEFQNKLDDALEGIKSVAQEIKELTEGKSVSKVQLKRLASMLDNSLSNLPRYLSFAVDSFKEITESMVEEAKAEVEAYALDVVTSAGIKALQEQPSTPVSLPFENNV